MDLTWDEAKRASNLAKHGVDFAKAAGFDWASARIVEDTRFAYPERRFQALGMVDGRLRMLVFTPRFGMVRIISFREANEKERKLYGI